MNIKDNFNNDGYVKINNFLSGLEFNNVSAALHKELNKSIESFNFSSIGGYFIGNINVNPGIHAIKIWELLISNKLDGLMNEIFNKPSNKFSVSAAGNLNFPEKGEQKFHTDGNFEDTMYLLSVATQDIPIESGPTEIVLDLHKSKIPYWKFILSKKIKKKIILKKGDIIIRKHCVWHRGTKNKSKNPRFLLTYLLFENSTNLKNNFSNNKELIFYNNFFKSDFKGKLKEFFYVKFGFIFSAYQFVRSMFL